MASRLSYRVNTSWSLPYEYYESTNIVLVHRMRGSAIGVNSPVLNVFFFSLL